MNYKDTVNLVQKLIEFLQQKVVNQEMCYVRENPTYSTLLSTFQVGISPHHLFLQSLIAGTLFHIIILFSGLSTFFARGLLYWSTSILYTRLCNRGMLQCYIAKSIVAIVLTMLIRGVEAFYDCAIVFHNTIIH